MVGNIKIKKLLIFSYKQNKIYIIRNIFLKDCILNLCAFGLVVSRMQKNDIFSNFHPSKGHNSTNHLRGTLTRHAILQYKSIHEISMHLDHRSCGEGGERPFGLSDYRLKPRLIGRSLFWRDMTLLHYPENRERLRHELVGVSAS